MPASQHDDASLAEPRPLFAALRDLLQSACTDGLVVVHDTESHFYANCARPDAKGKPQFFGAVKVSGRKHVFHFMPVYDHPALLAGISLALKQRMQGKSCFNFDRWEPALMDELLTVIEQGVACYRADGKLPHRAPA